MIPELNISGVLPPYDNAIGPTASASMAPYETTMSEFVTRYATSSERRTILVGLLDFRKQLREIGVDEGHQWLDGSFVENVESIRSRPPNDIDIVTFAFRPVDCLDVEKWKLLLSSNPVLFNTQLSKDKFKCDAYYVDLNVHPFHIVNQTRFWFGLFSHQKETNLWKGMIQISLNSDDENALKILMEETENA